MKITKYYLMKSNHHGFVKYSLKMNGLGVSFFIFVMFLSSCTTDKEGPEVEISASPSASLDLTAAQIDAYEERALSGDYAAASKLADYYYLAAPNRDQSIRWLRVMSQSGDLKAKANLATELSIRPTDMSCIESEKLYLEVINKSDDRELLEYAKLALSHLKTGCKKISTP